MNTSLVGGITKGFSEDSSSMPDIPVDLPLLGGGLVMGGRTAWFASLAESLRDGDVMPTNPGVNLSNITLAEI